MGANGQTLRDWFAASAAILARVRRGNRFGSLASICCCAREDGEKLAPPRVTDRFVEARFLAGPVGQIAAVPVRFGLGAGAEILGLNRFIHRR